MIPHEWLQQAALRLQPYIRQTPLIYDATHELYIKYEHHQLTGSFKIRGALNKIIQLEEWERQRGLVTASAGNHGQGVAYAGRLKNAPVIVFASEHAVPAKVTAMRDLGADVRFVPGGYEQAEAAGLAYAAQTGSTWVSPYNDGQVIAGQGTLGLEILQQLPTLSHQTWIVPAGGGGLVAGLGVALRSLHEKNISYPRPRLIAVQSDASPFLYSLFHTGSQEELDELPSLADGLSGPVELGSVTIPLVRGLVDDFRLVSENQIEAAIAWMWNHYQEVIEGSAAVALAAVLYGIVTDRPAIVILTGGNIDHQLHRDILRKLK
jgi:threonine dehydratase